ncbi:MAG: DUF1993 domain-containing protein [Alphaproteobacteria bacterium]|nr:DUF1993 domain-containing protein [Alphaproteobacteria bacterium]
MTLSMYQASVPTFIHGLQNLSAILTKAAAYAEAKKFEPSVLVNSRLFPDMFPLSRQIQITTDVIKGGVARLAGVEVPSYADDETTFEQLQARIAKTIAFLQSFKAEQIDGSEEKIIALKVGGNEMNFKGQPYLLTFVIPNFYFHITTTYAILRHNGLDIGKMDFLGKIQ